MDVPGVRLYMTSLFNKAAGDSASQWHKDIDASPFESDTPFLTLWIPLSANATTREMGTLEYAAKSHEDNCTYFDCDLPCDAVQDCYEVTAAAPLAVGDATLHTGRTFHYR